MKEADFYDNADKRRSTIPVEQSPFLPVYEKVANLLDGATPILDCGCGTGRFAKLLRNRNLVPWEYYGIDFSRVNIEIAQKYVPDYNFGLLDFRDDRFFQLTHIRDWGSFVFIEVLEHFDFDVEMVGSLPEGSTVVLTVPSYDSAAHVRHFADMDAVLERYGSILNVEHSEAYEINPGNFVFIVRGECLCLR